VGETGVMKRKVRVVKWLACIFGGACAAGAVLVLVAVLRFDRRDADGAYAFLHLWAPVAWALGGLAGTLVVLRSERRTAATSRG
jgi:hypothetical protein